MAQNPYSTMRFTHPDFQLSQLQSGFALDRTGRIAMVDENESVRQAILLLLTTRPGERVMRPGYGCEINKLVFAPNDDTTHGLAIHYIRTAILRWEPRAQILHLDAYCHAEYPSRMEIELEYKVIRTAYQETLVLPYDLGNEVTTYA